MTDRDPRRQRRRRGGARLSDADSHSPEAVGVGERTYGSPIRVPLTAAASTSFVPTPQVDARIENPFVDPNQVRLLNQDAGLQAPHAGDTSAAGGVNTAFWNTFGPFMPYNANLILSALGSMQQTALHPTPHHLPHPAVVSTPKPQAQGTAQQSGGRILPWSEPEVAVRDKSLIEPEGDTYMLYYRFSKYKMLSVSLEREPTVDELYRDTHMRRKKDNQGNWVCKKSELRLDEHLKRWHEYRSSHTSTDDSSQTPPLSEQDIWVQGNLTSKGRVYGFGAEGVLMKQRSRLSASTRSSSVHNYDAREMAMRLNEGVRRRLDKRRRLTTKRLKTFDRSWLKKGQRDKEKVKSKLSKLWRFFKSQQAGSSTAPPQDDDEDEPDPSHLGDSSED
ncbi:hypothetical protein Cgig2_022464 [Carnegiea gigantea]|uniref:Uncharacterized protein n=1 Tax=Carnegiea gigantea TaxID=171969 RepID=A0A9Q1K9U7_9CARY|nr:hypothetical protein Cgig2_022464 [Carnegiea gigantea]